MSRQPVAIGLPDQQWPIPVRSGGPNEPLYLMVNSGHATVFTCDEEGRISSEMVPLIDAVEQIEAFIAKLKADGHVDRSLYGRKERENAKVVAMVRE